jgi:hypothetical protein
MGKHWWEDRVQPGMLFVSKTQLYCGGAYVPGSSGLLDPGEPALVVGTERVAGSVTYAIMGKIGLMDATSFLSIFERVEGRKIEVPSEAG